MPSTNSTPVNTTPDTDIVSRNCFSNFNTVACIRSASLTFLAVVTGVLCVMKIMKFHLARHQSCHQYFIFYCASLECTVGGIHWILSTYIQLDFVLQWLKLIQFLVMCHFYWTLATRALRREVWAKRFLIPFLLLACGYFTVIACLGIINVQSPFVECLEPYWLELSSAEFLIVQLFCVAGFYITRRLNEISTLDSVRRTQKRDLWCIVIVFEVSAFIGVLYDVTLQILGDKNTGCSAIFNHIQELYSPIFVTFMVIKLLAPVWVMLFVFSPTPPVLVENDDLIPAVSEDGTSAFSSTADEHYRQLYHPAENYQSLNGSMFQTPSTPCSPSSSQVKINKSTTSLDPIKEETSVNSTPHQEDTHSSNENIQETSNIRGKFYI
ncbi:hypothetical protein CHS0354_007872 [Potamilus streckersoni]|uniref:Uncharacterized protein n=1 Tax=Potamilus streckersoni TaxID=2493646 RepID=A0AAE0SYL9_9BIVA|nr:hypothetical protein CHS0354_007872 [Potamilus streckersoni]